MSQNQPIYTTVTVVRYMFLFILVEINKDFRNANDVKLQ